MFWNGHVCVFHGGSSDDLVSISAMIWKVVVCLSFIPLIDHEEKIRFPFPEFCLRGMANCQNGTTDPK